MDTTESNTNAVQESEGEESNEKKSAETESMTDDRKDPEEAPVPMDTGQTIKVSGLPLATFSDADSDEEEEEEEGDREFTGKIVYNPDGSAYIIEGSEVSDVESEVGVTILKEGGIVDDGSNCSNKGINSINNVTVSQSQIGNSSYKSHNSNNSSNCPNDGIGTVGESSTTGTMVPILPKVVAAHHISIPPSLSNCYNNSGTTSMSTLDTSRILSIMDKKSATLPSNKSSSSSCTTNVSNLQLQQQQSKVPDVPIMHSYRVYTLRDENNCSTAKTLMATSPTLSPTNTSTTTTTTPGDSIKNEEEESSTECINKNVSSVPVKPILMCFICKISFGYTKSFVSHATSEHRLELVEEESRLLSLKNCSAIIQGVGKDKEPLLSFLEPKNQTPLTSRKALVGQNLTTPTIPIRQASPSSSSSTSAIPVPGSKVSASPPIVATSPSTANPGDLHQQFQQQLMAMQVAAMAAMRHHGTSGVVGQSSSVSSSSTTTNHHSSSSSPSSQAQQQFLNSLAAVSTSQATSLPMSNLSMADMNLTAANTKENSNQSCSSSRPNSSSNGSLNLVLPKNNNNTTDNEGDGINSGKSDQQQPDGCSELVDLANLEKIAKAAAAAIQSQSQQSEQCGGVDTFGSTSPPMTTLSQSPNSTSTLSSMSLMAMVQQQQQQQQSSSPKGSSQSQLPSQQSQSYPGQPGMPDSHMTMMHSRNSCKTLKCPKCNWHYKYQETLEIHMKEKHPENEMNCIYCLTNQSHPRLARGETYTCGYKPYRCEVCNYSTTTKGNLSIHMQSDKHINNVQELQNGNIPVGSEHLIQSQALAALAAASAASSTSGSTPTPTGSNSVPKSASTSSAPNASVNPTVSASVPGSSSFGSVGGPTGSNASSPGIQDKASPVNTTVPILSGLIHPPNSQTPIGQSSSASSGSGSNNKPKATWRCDVCNYETGVARNLRIHMTSEKHTHNMVVLQQSVKHYQALSAMQQQAGLMAAMSGGDPMAAQLAAAQMAHPGFLAALAAAASSSGGSNQNPSLQQMSQSPNSNDQQQQQPTMSSEAALADMAYNHAVMLMQQQQQRAMALMGGGGSKSPFQLPGQGQQQQPMVDMEHPDPSFRFDAIPYEESARSFQCCVCTIYTCDSIEGLSQHIQSDRTRIREDEVLMAAGGNYICKLCSYKTSLKANFQLHCKTDKHLQRLQQVNHIKEGGNRSEWKLKYVNVSNPIQVRCNLCDYYTNSIHKLQLHSTNPLHETLARIFVHLQLSETILRSSQSSTRGNECIKNYYYNCSMCNFAARSKINLVHHVNSMKHSAAEVSRQQMKNQSSNKSLEEEIREMFQVKELHNGDNVNFGDNEPLSSSSPSSPHGSIEDVSMMDHSPVQSRGGMPSSTAAAAMNSMPSGGMDPMLAAALNFESSFLKHALQEQERQQQLHSPQVRHFDTSGHSSGVQCPFCNYTCSSDVKMQLHVLTQHANKRENVSNREPKVRLLCPLCQEAFEERVRLESHLMDVHNVTKEGVERLLSIVDTSDTSESSKKRKVTNASNDEDNIPNDDGRSDCSSTDGRGGEAESIEQTAARFLKLGGGIPLAAVSDRHVYKYRCQQCSLAFKTKEKLQLHSQYHLIRAATQCVLCNRSFRSVEALQRHVEQVHRDTMTEGEVESYRASLANNPFLGRNGTMAGILDPSTTELLMKESNRGMNDDNDCEESAMDLAMSSLEQSIADDRDNDGNFGTSEDREHNSLEDYLNSQAMAEDSYNDPSRKYKCHRCKVAFTRQSYLTAHNKTLLHRKGEKVDYPLEKYLDPNRPFKCEICKESFTQKNILLVHYNSVSHLHRSKQLKMKSEGQSSSSSERRENSDREQAVQSALLQSLTQSSMSPNEQISANSMLFPMSSVSPSSSTGHGSEEKKPFKCNICKVSYNLASSLDIHIRSVLHQSRASKINELILMGQIDLSLPFIERGSESESTTTTTTESRKCDTKVSAKDHRSSSPMGQQQFGISEIQLQQQLQQQLTLAAMAQAGMAGQASGNGVFPCGRCGALFPSQEISIQHQQLCSLFGPPIMNPSGDAVPRPSGMVQVSGSSKFYSAPAHRTKPPIYKHLLETFGFEIVMQFNEHHQRRKRMKIDEIQSIDIQIVDNQNSDKSKSNNTDIVDEDMIVSIGTNKEQEQESDLNPNVSKPTTVTGDESVVGTNESTRIETSTKEESEEDTNKKISISCPEINRSVCNICTKEFSSIWVLKAHKEEVHKQMIPFDFVESFADTYREEFDKKKLSEPKEVDTITPSSEAIVSNVNNESTGSHRPTPSQTPTLIENRISQSNNNNNSSPQVTNTSPQNQSSQPSAETGMNPAAAQLAAQMQFSQLLMQMGLAGMAVPGMGNVNPFAAAAAMGIPPPMIPLMMASGQFDPMMAAAFSHQAAAQAAAAQGAVPGSSPNPSEPMSDGSMSFAAQQKILQQQQMAAAAAQQGKRARTRITDEQLKILRQYFDINNSPSEEALQEMSEKSGLPLKVIKHWFRNTLFKERQRNKDSPYNFNNPPSTFLNLEEYEKTGETKITSIDSESALILSAATSTTVSDLKNHIDTSINDYGTKRDTLTPKMSSGIRASTSKVIKEEIASSDDDNHHGHSATVHRTSINSSSSGRDTSSAVAETSSVQPQPQVSVSGQVSNPSSSNPNSLRESFDYAKSFSMSPHSESSMSSISTNDTPSQNGDHGHGQSSHRSMSQSQQQQVQMFAGLPAFASAASMNNPALQMAIDAAQRSQSVNSSQGGSQMSSTPRGQSGGGQGGQNDPHGSSPGSGSGGPGKRANRTRFTDYQIKVLQEFFEQNAYPKDDDLEYLSKLLNLSPRVIVVWFQNARQKARKVYENQPAAPEDADSQGRFQRTPGLNYQCKKCQQVFQRYYELIKHQKSACFKDENPLSAHLRAAAENRQTGSTSPGAVSASGGNMSNHSASVSTTPTPDKSASPSANAFRCEKCSLVFPRFDLWREHQLVHLMNPNLFPNSYPPQSPFGILQFEGQNSNNPSTSPQAAGVLASIMSSMNNNNNTPAVAPVTPTTQNKRKQSIPMPTLPLPPPDEDDFSEEESFSGHGSQTGSVTDRNNETPQSRDKRLRTTILPEQLDYLYQKYQLESNPSRKMLENIAKEVGLKKRVVQVWFQNTRARERKGQFRAHQQVIHKRCPFCRALFKARSALESHLATRHADQYTKGDINIDALPDGEPDDLPQTPFGQFGFPSADAEDKSPSENQMNDLQAKQWKKYMEEFAAAVPNVPGMDSLPPELALTMRAALGGRLPGEHSTTPLDLSKPVDLTRSLASSFGGHFAFDGNGYDSHSDDGAESGSDLDDNDDMMMDNIGESSPNSPTGAGSTNSSITGASPAGIGASGVPRNSTSSNSNKRFRTQMTTVQLKVMKSIFADYKTPSMAECDSLGRDIGLPKRVIQVWFQNARAKEKKARLNFAKSFGHEMPEVSRSIDGCKVCSVRYNPEVSSTALQDHLFSKSHLENLKSHIDSTKKGTSTGHESANDESVDYPGASMIVMPPNHNNGPQSTGDNEDIDPPVTQSQSVNNLMQLMGLAFSNAASVGGGMENNNNEPPGLNGGGPRFMANNFTSMANHQQFKQPNL